MNRPLLAATLGLGLGLGAVSTPGFAQENAPPSAGEALSFPASFFAEAQPATAYDMIQRVPGFMLDTGDADVRGLAGANGNVLLDGKWPAAKDDTLDSILKRIPASAVLRIDLIRGGAGGIDMRGQPVLANIVRRGDARLGGQVEATFGRYGDGRVAPSLRANVSRNGGGTLTEGSAFLYQSIDDEKGFGPRVRTNPDGSPREDATYDEHDTLRGAELSLGHERGFAGGRLQLNGSLKRLHERAHTDLAFLAPDPGLEQVLELETEDNAEIGAAWSRALGPALSLELTGLQRFNREDASERSDDEAEIEEVAERSRGGESVGRALLRWQPGTAFTLEGGAEAAYNFLDSHSALSVDGAPVALPAANVRVAEKRAEGFATALWHPSDALTVEAGIRVETSRLAQTGDSQLTKQFVFPKPRVALTWSSGPRTQWRARLERDVSQLDFGDFVSSTSLTSSTITAGNAELEPQRTWTASLAWERRFWKDAALVLAARHEWISHTLDRVGVSGPGFAFDAPGNIGPGRKDKIEASLSLPLDRVGIAGGLLKGEVGYRWTSVLDPTTGAERPISGEEPWDGEVHFTQDRPGIGVRWGVDYILPKDEYEYRFDEVRRERIGGRWSVFAEYRFAPQWTVRAFAENLTGRHVRRDRAIYAGPRDVAALRYDEARDLATRPLVGLQLRRRLGH
jgi:hypothetical protein